MVTTHKRLKKIFANDLNCFYEQVRTGIDRKSTVQSINQISESKTKMDQISLKGEYDNLLFHKRAHQVALE